MNDFEIVLKGTIPFALSDGELQALDAEGYEIDFNNPEDMADAVQNFINDNLYEMIELLVRERLS